MPLNTSKLPFQQARELVDNIPNVRALFDSSKKPEERISTFGDQLKGLFKRLYYIFFLPISWFFTFTHAIQQIIVHLSVSISFSCALSLAPKYIFESVTSRLGHDSILRTYHPVQGPLVTFHLGHIHLDVSQRPRQPTPLPKHV